jgi:hypothetical protein
MAPKPRRAKGLNNIKLIGISKGSSMPRMKNSNYLDLHILQKKKDMLKDEFKIFKKRESIILKKIDEIDAEMAELEGLKTIKAEENANPFENSGEKNWKTVPITY